MEDSNLKLKQDVINNLKKNPLKYLKYFIKKGETPFQTINKSEIQNKKNSNIFDIKHFQKKVESGDAVLGSRRSGKMRILTKEQMELHKKNKRLLDYLGGKPRTLKKRTSKKRTSKKRTSKKRTSKKRTSKKRTSKKRTSKKRTSKKRTSQIKKLSDKEKLCRSKKIKSVMGEFKEKKLKLRNGSVVKNPRQAIAIALSQAGRYC
jgi:hypothetical protein